MSAKLAPMNRRGFLQACLALAAAPAIVRASSLMQIRAPRTNPWLDSDGSLVFDGVDSYLNTAPFDMSQPFTFWGPTNRVKTALIGGHLFSSPDPFHAPTLEAGGLTFSSEPMSAIRVYDSVVFNRAHSKADAEIISDAMLRGDYRIEGSRMFVNTPRRAKA